MFARLRNSNLFFSLYYSIYCDVFILFNLICRYVTLEAAGIRRYDTKNLNPVAAAFFNTH